MINDKHLNRIEAELLRIITGRNTGSVLSRFQDWPAAKAPEDVERGLRFLGRHAGPLQNVRQHRLKVVGIGARR
jgi:predicted ABC-type transport system involved in lysophospholipase L1 biosynthesis ATPase subunit